MRLHYFTCTGKCTRYAASNRLHAQISASVRIALINKKWARESRKSWKYVMVELANVECNSD